MCGDLRVDNLPPALAPMKPAPFAYETAPDLAGALDLLARHGGEAKVLAGGQSLVPLLNFRLARPSALIDINGVDELDYVRVDGEIARLGALVRHARLEGSNELASRVPLLREAVRHVGHAQIRNRGTIGGSVAHADPAAELPAVLCTLDASFRLRSVRGDRRLDWTAFFRGALETALDPDELLTEIEVRLPAAGSGQAFCEFARRRGDFAIGGAAAVVTLAGDGTCARARLGLLSAAAVPVRARSAEELLEGRRVDEAAASGAADEAVRGLSPPGDIHGGPTFRRRVIRELVRRALLAASSRAASPAEGCA